MSPVPARANVLASVRWKTRTVSAPLPARTNSAEPPRIVEFEPSTSAASDGPSERVEAGQRPDGDERRRGDGERAADRAGEGERRAQRAHRAGYPAGGLGDPAHAGRLEQEQPEQHEVDELRRSGQQRHQQRRRQRPARRSAHRSGGVGHRPRPGCRSTSAAPIAATAAPVARPCRTRARSSTSRPLAVANRSITPGLREERGGQHRPPADVVRQCAEHEQRHEHGHRVDTEDNGHRHRQRIPNGPGRWRRAGWARSSWPAA